MIQVNYYTTVVIHGLFQIFKLQVHQVIFDKYYEILHNIININNILTIIHKMHTCTITRLDLHHYRDTINKFTYYPNVLIFL